MILASRLQGISDHLDSHKIEHMLYKGHLFAEVYYGNLRVARIPTDLDVIRATNAGKSKRRAMPSLSWFLSGSVWPG